MATARLPLFDALHRRQGLRRQRPASGVGRRRTGPGRPERPGRGARLSSRSAVGRVARQRAARVLDRYRRPAPVRDRVQGHRDGRAATGEVTGTSGNVAWAADNQTVFYVENDPETLLAKRVKRHVLGTDPASDALVYEEPDKSFYMGVGAPRTTRSSDRLSSTVTSESRCFAADDARRAVHGARAARTRPRVRPDHVGGRWIIRTNWQAQELPHRRGDRARVGDRAQWRDVVPHRRTSSSPASRSSTSSSRRANGARGCASRASSLERRQGTSTSRPTSRPTRWASAPTARPTPRRALHLHVAHDALDATTTTCATGERTLLKRDAGARRLRPARYATERLWAPARDGAQVPVSIVYRKDTRRDGTAPLLPVRLRLLRHLERPAVSTARGSACSIAASSMRSRTSAVARRWAALVRGRQAAEEEQHVHGLHRRHASLVAKKYGAADKVFAMGGSAGGLLMGAVANMAPDRTARSSRTCRSSTS